MWLLETLDDILINVELFMRYDVCDAFEAFYAACTYDNIEIWGTMAFIFLALALYIPWYFNYELVNFYEWLHPGWNTPFPLSNDLEDSIIEEELPRAIPYVPIIRVSPCQAPHIPPATTTPVTKSEFPYEHFRATGESFLSHLKYSTKKGSAIQYPSIWKDIFLNEDDEIKRGFVRVPKPHYGYEWKFVGTHKEDEDTLSSAIEELEEPKALVITEADPTETAKPPMITHEIAAVPPQPLLPPPVSAHLQIPSPASTQAPQTCSSALVQPNEVLQAPPQAPVLELVQPAVVSKALYEETFQDRVDFVFSFFANKLDELRIVMQTFLVPSSVQEQTDCAVAIHALIGEALKSLQIFFPDGLAADRSCHMGWNRLLEEFWDQIRPHGYALQQDGPQHIITLLEDTFLFGRYLGLSLQPLDCTPPPPPPPPPQQLPAQLTPEVVQQLLHQLLPPSQPPLPIPEQLPQLPPQLPPQPVPLSRPLCPMPPIHPVHTTPQQFTTPKPTEGFLVPPAPAQQVLQKLQNESESSQQEPEKEDLNVMDFDSPTLAEWYSKTDEELNELTPESFGWYDKEAARTKIWQYSGAKDLMLSGNLAVCTNSAMVKMKLNAIALHFKRLSVVLRMQAHAGDLLDYTDLAPLANEMTHCFKRAGEMTDACGGMPSSDPWREWGFACLYFHNEVYAEASIVKPLRRQYGSAWKDLERTWEAVEGKWLREKE